VARERRGRARSWVLDAGRGAAGFVVGPLLALVFGIYWPIFRVGGYEPGDPSFLVLPVITLALPVAAYVARLMRDSMRRCCVQLTSAPRAPRAGSRAIFCATRCGRR
jgi:hypothetical protein